MRKCRICNKENFRTVIDFGETPLVNSLVDAQTKNLGVPDKVYPLKVIQCQECLLVQTEKPISSEKIYRDQDYLYFSGDMPNLSDYFREYADDITQRFLDDKDFIVEIGSNDGTMLKAFPHKKLGVDPSTNVVVRALADGIPTVSDGFTPRLARNIKRYFGEAKVIFGNNCIAHIDDLHGVMRGVKTLLQKDGVFIVECNYWGGMVENKNYSLIYHDHFSYFTVKSWENMAKEYGFHIIDAVVTPAQGGSLRIFMTPDKTKMATERLEALIAQEESTDLNSYETANRFRKEVTEKAESLGTLIKKLKAEGKTIAGYGAAAKGFSILHLAGITDELDFFVDDSPAKQGKFTPVNHIPVIAREKAKDPDYFFITAPNYADVIMEKEKKFSERGGKFILEDGTIK